MERYTAVESNESKKRGDAGWCPSGSVGAEEMSRLGGRRPFDCDAGLSDVVVADANGGVRGCVGVGIKAGDIQRGGPPP